MAAKETSAQNKKSAEEETKKVSGEINFEQSLLSLEEIVAKLETGDLSLEDAMNLYEQGVKLTITLNHRLKDAKLKIEDLKGNKNEA